jgi:hypothetical protein
MSNLVGITGKRGLVRDIAIMYWLSPVALLGACGSDAADGTCPSGQVLRYESAGCGAAAKPVCGSPTQDACYRAVCSCQGQTISCCDYAPEPFASFGACTIDSGPVDSGPDLAHDQALPDSDRIDSVDGGHDKASPDMPNESIDLSLDRPLDRPIDVTVDGSLDGERLDVSGDVGIDGVIDSSYDGGACPAGQVLRYESPGCGVDAKPVCGSPSQDACWRSVCSCKGVTISRCDYATEPFASFGSCDANSPG